MNYRIIVENKVKKDVRNIPKEILQRIDKVILELASNPRPYGCIKLTEKEGYRLRVGDYRVLYTIDDKMKVVIIYRIKRRSERTYK